MRVRKIKLDKPVLKQFNLRQVQNPLKTVDPDIVIKTKAEARKYANKLISDYEYCKNILLKESTPLGRIFFTMMDIDETMNVKVDLHRKYLPFIPMNEQNTHLYVTQVDVIETQKGWVYIAHGNMAIKNQRKKVTLTFYEDGIVAQCGTNKIDWKKGTNLYPFLFGMRDSKKFPTFCNAYYVKLGETIVNKYKH